MVSLGNDLKIFLFG